MGGQNLLVKYRCELTVAHIFFFFIGFKPLDYGMQNRGMTAVLREMDVARVKPARAVSGSLPVYKAVGPHPYSQRQSPTPRGRLWVSHIPGGRRLLGLVTRALEDGTWSLGR